MSGPWPRLSETLAQTKHPHICQSCGAVRGDLTRWREHDDNDQPEALVVVLCKRCSDRLIEPHPRLYAQMQPGEPAPGTMDCCAACTHRAGLACTHSALKANGGPGLKLTYPPPTRAFVCKRGGRGGPTTIYTGSVTCCGRQEIAPGQASGEG